jgi:IS5 family transposase
VAADGALASKHNLEEAKARGLDDVVFAKKRGLSVEDMASSTWVYRQLRNFRAGIEGMISFLKRVFGLARCTWKGAESFASYVGASVVSANLLLFARRLMT